MTSIHNEQRYCVVGLGRRALAGAIDLAVLLPVVLFFAMVIALVGGRAPHSWSELGPGYVLDLALDGGGVGLAVSFVMIMVVFLYFFIFHLMLGQTPGKRLLGAAVIDIYGARPSITRALVRTASAFFSLAAFSIGLLWIGFDREHRALHDLLAGTYVVDVRHAPLSVSANEGAAG